MIIRLVRMALLFFLSIPLQAPDYVFSMEVFRFVAPDGTLHFTNVPTDPRYRRLAPKDKKGPLRKDRRRKIQMLIEEEARVQGVEPALIKAVIHAESDFDAEAVSSAGALGLMQLMPATVSDLRVKDPFDPEENIRGGIRHLRSLLELFNRDVTLALAAYHAGAGNVLKYGRVPPIEETHLYIGRVLRFYKMYAVKKDRPPLIYKGIQPTGEMIFTNRPERYPKLSLSQFKE
jgi:soluble lytic murein transglycosylase-like protein